MLNLFFKNLSINLKGKTACIEASVKRCLDLHLPPRYLLSHGTVSLIKPWDLLFLYWAKITIATVSFVSYMILHFKNINGFSGKKRTMYNCTCTKPLNALYYYQKQFTVPVSLITMTKISFKLARFDHRPQSYFPLEIRIDNEFLCGKETVSIWSLLDRSSQEFEE